MGKLYQEGLWDWVFRSREWNFEGNLSEIVRVAVNFLDSVVVQRGDGGYRIFNNVSDAFSRRWEMPRCVAISCCQGNQPNNWNLPSVHLNDGPGPNGGVSKWRRGRMPLSAGIHTEPLSCPR